MICVVVSSVYFCGGLEKTLSLRNFQQRLSAGKLIVAGPDLRLMQIYHRIWIRGVGNCLQRTRLMCCVGWPRTISSLP